MMFPSIIWPAGLVAPLAGSVDRNPYTKHYFRRQMLSLPSRGAWIEITFMMAPSNLELVAPLAGSVDRNGDVTGIGHQRVGRSPRGERG